MRNSIRACIANLIKIQKQVEGYRDSSSDEGRAEILDNELESIELAIDALNEIE